MQPPSMPAPSAEDLQRLRRVHNPIKKRELFAKTVLLSLGALIFAMGLKAFLVPNQIIDGASSASPSSSRI